MGAESIISSKVSASSGIFLSGYRVKSPIYTSGGGTGKVTIFEGDKVSNILLIYKFLSPSLGVSVTLTLSELEEFFISEFSATKLLSPFSIRSNFSSFQNLSSVGSFAWIDYKT